MPLTLAMALPVQAADPFTPAQLNSLHIQIQTRASMQNARVTSSPKEVVPRLLRFSNGMRIGYLDLMGRVVIPPVFDAAYEFSDGKLAVRMDGKWGYIDYTGKVVIEPRYEQISLVWQLPLQGKMNGRWGLLNEKGDWIVQALYDELRESGEYFEVRSGAKWGVIDRTGRILIRPSFDGIVLPENEKHPIIVLIDKKWGFANRSGKLIGEAQYDRLDLYPSGLAIVRKGAKHGLVDITGRILLPIEHDGISATPNRDRWIVENKGLYGVVDLKGKQIIDQDYQLISTNGAKHFNVVKGHTALANIDGQFITDFIFGSIDYFYDGLAAAAVDGKWGYVDTSGKLLIAPRFTSARAFSQGVASVSLDGKYGYINNIGAFVVVPQFEDANSFFPDGIATVKVDGHYFYIDRTGARIAPLLQPDVATVQNFPFAK